LLQVYDLKHGRALGAGSFGTVRVVTHKNSGKEFALKTVEIKGLKDAAQFNLFMNEVEIMKASRYDSFDLQCVMLSSLECTQCSSCYVLYCAVCIEQ
jgi:serine/threonine protein kinase